VYRQGVGTSVSFQTGGTPARALLRRRLSNGIPVGRRGRRSHARVGGPRTRHTRSQEWISGLTYDPTNAGWLSLDAVRQSFHANARAHAQLGRCRAEFYTANLPAARCLVGGDGNLDAVR
jgi:hypothetical protein